MIQIEKRIFIVSGIHTLFLLFQLVIELVQIVTATTTTVMLPHGPDEVQLAQTLRRMLRMIVEMDADHVDNGGGERRSLLSSSSSSAM
jgi:hypothetical protein